MKKERLLEFDILRGLAFIFIVIQHTIGGFSFRDDITTNGLFISKFIYTIAKIATPLFVCLTGISLLYTYYEKFNAKDFYVKKLKFLVLPLVFWSLLIMYNDDKSFNYDTALIIFSGDAQFHLWYMGMILRVYLYFPLILFLTKIINTKNHYIKILSFLAFAFCYLLLLNNYGILDKVTNFLFTNPTESQQRLVNITPLFYYFYFVIGAYIILNYKIFKEFILKYKYVLAIVYLITLIYYYYIELSDQIGNPFPYIKSSNITSVFYNSISILFFYIVAYYITTKLKYVFNIIKFISKYSFPAYLIHVLVINKLTLHVPTTQYLGSPIKYLLLTITISISICFLLNYLPYSEYLIGNKSKFNIKKLIEIFKKLTPISTKNNTYFPK